MMSVFEKQEVRKLVKLCRFLIFVKKKKEIINQDYLKDIVNVEMR